MGVNGQQRVRQNNSSSPSSSFVCVCVGVWLVKHSGILTSRAVSLVSNLWPFFTLAACACCVIILIRQHTTTTTGRWCWPFIQMGHKSMRVWYLTILSSLIIIYKFRPDVSSLRKKKYFPFFFPTVYFCRVAAVCIRRFIYCPSRPAKSNDRASAETMPNSISIQSQ